MISYYLNIRYSNIRKQYKGLTSLIVLLFYFVPIFTLYLQ